MKDDNDLFRKALASRRAKGMDGVLSLRGIKAPLLEESSIDKVDHPFENEGQEVDESVNSFQGDTSPSGSEPPDEAQEPHLKMMLETNPLSSNPDLKARAQKGLIK